MWWNLAHLLLSLAHSGNHLRFSCIAPEILKKRKSLLCPSMSYKRGSLFFFTLRCTIEREGAQGKQGERQVGIKKQTTTKYCQHFHAPSQFYSSFKRIIKIHLLNETSDTEFLASFPSPKDSPKGKNRLLSIIHLLSTKCFSYTSFHQQSLITAIVTRKWSLREIN